MAKRIAFEVSTEFVPDRITDKFLVNAYEKICPSKKVTSGKRAKVEPQRAKEAGAQEDIA